MMKKKESPTNGKSDDWLTGNEIENEGINLLSEMLEVNTTLTSLMLESKGISKETCKKE